MKTTSWTDTLPRLSAPAEDTGGSPSLPGSDATAATATPAGTVVRWTEDGSSDPLLRSPRQFLVAGLDDTERALELLQAGDERGWSTLKTAIILQRTGLRLLRIGRGVDEVLR